MLSYLTEHWRGLLVWAIIAVLCRLYYMRSDKYKRKKYEKRRGVYDAAARSLATGIRMWYPVVYFILADLYRELPEDCPEKLLRLDLSLSNFRAFVQEEYAQQIRQECEEAIERSSHGEQALLGDDLKLLVANLDSGTANTFNRPCKPMEEFLQKIPPTERKALCARGTDARQNLRHIYCVKAAELVDLPMQTKASRHSDDASYTGRFTDEMNLMGEISRTAILRHLMILSMPFISAELLNERLELLGYLPLTEDHSDRSGNAVDAFLLRLLALYDLTCAGRTPAACAEWLRAAISWFDVFFASQGRPGLCVFQFKHLRNRAAEGAGI